MVYCRSADRRAPHGQRDRVPRAESMQPEVNETYERFTADIGGKYTDYVSASAKVDSKLFGIAVVTADNQDSKVGDVAPHSINNERLLSRTRDREIGFREHRLRSRRRSLQLSGHCSGHADAYQQSPRQRRRDSLIKRQCCRENGQKF